MVKTNDASRAYSKNKKHLKKLEFIWTTTMHHQNIHIQKDTNEL